MTIERKLLSTSPSGGATDVAEVFSVYPYKGTSGGRSINNGIDLSGEGGLTWIKGRTAGYAHNLYDTERGATHSFASSSNAASVVKSDGLTAFNSNGFSLSSNGAHNSSGQDYISWTFRKKKKFFDIVTYTGNGANRTIAHSLGGPVGFMAVKRLNSLGAMTTFHRSLGATKFMEMHSTHYQQTGSAVWNNTAPTNAVFSLGTDSAVNASGSTYVAYLWADNSSEDLEEQMVICNNATYSGANNIIQLPWQPQFMFVKSNTNTDDWTVMDTSRGFEAEGSNGVRLKWNSNAAEESGSLKIERSNQVIMNLPTYDDYIYMAIRVPMMVEPEAATDVFAIDNTSSTNPGYVTPSWAVDMAIRLYTSGGNNDFPMIVTRLMQNIKMKTSAINSEQSNEQEVKFDYANGWWTGSGSSALPSLMWKRAKGFFDVVNYKGTGSNRAVPHSLGVVPEMIWVKSRNNVKSWAVYHPAPHAVGDTIFLDNDHAGAGVGSFQSTAVSATTFNVDTAEYANRSEWRYIAYLFATLEGISKVGSYTGTGSDINVDCGFSAGARFILIKRYGATGDWVIYDTTRGIVAGADPFLELNTTDAQNTGNDGIDPLSSGFTVTSSSGNNTSGGTYIFYAIA